MYEINCSQTHRHTELHIDKHMDIKEKKIKKTTNVVIDGPSDTIRLYYSLYYYCINYPNGLIVSLYEKKKMIIIKSVKFSTSITFIWQCRFSFY